MLNDFMEWNEYSKLINNAENLNFVVSTARHNLRVLKSRGDDIIIINLKKPIYKKLFSFLSFFKSIINKIRSVI